MKSQEPSNQENNTKLKRKNSHPQIKYFCHTSKGSWTAWGNFWKNTTYKQYSSSPQKYNKCYSQQRTEGTPLTTAGVYCIACSCGQVCIGTIKRSIHARIKEHGRHCSLKQPEKSAVAEHVLKQAGHEILFQNTEILDNTSNHYVRLHREAIEIHKHQQNFNKKEESLKLNKTWLPALKNTACKKSTNSTQLNQDHYTQKTS